MALLERKGDYPSGKKREEDVRYTRKGKTTHAWRITGQRKGVGREEEGENGK